MFVWPEGGGRYTAWAYSIWVGALDPGRYDIVIAARTDASRYLSELRTMDLKADPPNRDVSFELGGAWVNGRVVMPDGVTGIPGITVTGQAVAGDGVILNGRMHEWGHIQVETDGDGTFNILGLLPGDYELRAHLPEEFYGPRPTLRLRLAANQKASAVLRAQRVEW